MQELYVSSRSPSSLISITVLEHKHRFQFAETRTSVFNFTGLICHHACSLTPITRPAHCGTVIVIMSAAKLRSSQRKAEMRHHDSIV